MEKQVINLSKDFFPKEVALGTPHPVSCTCDVCLRCDKLLDDLTVISEKLNSQKVNSSKSEKICNFLNAEMLETLGSGNSPEFEELISSYQRIWEKDIDGNPIGHINLPHEDSCKCLLCSVKKDFQTNLDEFCSSKLTIDDDDILEIIEEKPLNSQISRVNKSSSVVSDNGKKQDPKASSDVDLSFNKTNSENIDFNALVDICLCEPDTISPNCFKHAIAYYQHMETKLYEEGCTCTVDIECLFCQRLKCNYCNHERTVPPCSFLNDEETDDLTLKISSWLDDKLLEAGVSPETIKQFSEPLDNLKTPKRTDDNSKIDDNKDISEHLADHIDRNLLESRLWNFKPVGGHFTVNNKMKDEILNMNELFDIRLFPRCYKLKGVKNEKGVFTDLEEEYIELGFDAWKVPTQYVEETYPLVGDIPDLEERLKKEEDIRRKTRNQRSSSSKRKVKVIGLSDDWRPIVEVCPDDADYCETISDEDKQAWAQRIYEEIMDKCESTWLPEVENEAWSRVQPILDDYCEESVPDNNPIPDELKKAVQNLDSLLEDAFESSKHILEKFPNTGIGYKPEFWDGLEDWRPDRCENHVRKLLIDEVRKISKELNSFKNDFERVLNNKESVKVNAEDMINSIIESLPSNLSQKVTRMLSELPPRWLENPEIGLMELEQSNGPVDGLLKKNIEKLLSKDSSKSEPTSSDGTTDTSYQQNESFHDFDDELNGAEDTKQEAFFYDDEEVAGDDKELLGGSMTSAADDAENKGDKSTVNKSTRAVVQPTTMGASAKRYVHSPAPYVEKLKEDMLKKNPNGLHPIQKVWYDKPMFPFWTPSVVYDLSDIEKEFFTDVPEYSPDITESQLNEYKKRFSYYTDDISDQEPPSSSSLVQSVNEIEKLKYAEASDGTDSSATADKQPSAVTHQLAEPISSKQSSAGKKKKDGEKKMKIKKTVSDDDCLIKEDDFKLAVEQMLKAQAAKAETEKNDKEDTGGALGLEQILKGVAGDVKSQKEGAVELNSNDDINLEAVVPHPALKYSFKLDIFQKQAIIALEAGLSVFVAAHTSAGKTVAAEYAIAMALRSSCRVVYTSPIKALSNQKYNDFTKKFKGNMKVGIITGDVQLNKEAECLIMTTEILRSMLYNQSSILSDLEFVVFDEVHYFNDPERGNVWEEVLILLPQQCQLIMLSATVPDVMNFASWVGSLRKRTVIVTATTKRPVPLKHYIHFSTKPNLVKKVLPLREAEGPFLSHNYNNAMDYKIASTNYKRVRYGMPGGKEWALFIRDHLKEHQRLPAVIFSFSRKRCDDLASSINNIDLVPDNNVKRHIEYFFNRQINLLQPEDRNIEQIVTMKSLLQRGIGVHHSGILPILKEIVEVLFSESQIKLLFATETFAMGVNMPAKTVVFQQTRKFDGVDHRPLKPAEYTQMAGRAGRRGIDKSGTVIVTEWNSPERSVKESDLKVMLTGQVDPLKSQFRLRYSMILTALKPEGEYNIQSIIDKSYFDFSFKAQRNKTEKQAEIVHKDLTKVREEMAKIPLTLRDCLSDFCNIGTQYFNQHDSIREKMFDHKAISNYLTTGRMVTICFGKYINVFGILLNVEHVSTNKKLYDIVVLKGSQFLTEPISTRYHEATPENNEMWYRIVGLRKRELLPASDVTMLNTMNPLELLHCKASNILKIVKDVQCKINKNEALAAIEILRSRKRSGSELIDMIHQFFCCFLTNQHKFNFVSEDQFKFNDKEISYEILKYYKVGQALDENLVNVRFPIMENNQLLHHLQTCFWFNEKKKMVDKCKIKAQKEELTSLFNDFESKLKFLKNNKYIKEDDDVVDTKGRIASRMTNFEVFVTEILLKNVLEELNGVETAALLSCLIIPGVSTERSESSNLDNPLFERIESDEEDVNDLQMKLDDKKFSGGRRKFGHDDIKKMNTVMNETEKELKVCKEKRKAKNALIREYLTISPALKEATDTVDKIRMDLIQQENKLGIEPMEGADLNRLTFFLVPIVYAWAKGVAIKDIKQVLTSNIQEGILVRWIINLNETIKDIDSATHHFLKDSRIKEKFENASASIKRGIIDTPSLYLKQTAQTL